MADKTEEEPLKEKLNEKVINTKKKKMSCCKCLFWTFSVFVGVIACLVGGIYYVATKNQIPEEIAVMLGEEGVQAFKAFDRDDDGYISVSEFEPMYHYLVSQSGSPGAWSNITEKNVEYEQLVTEGDEVLTVVPSFKPLLLTSMMRDLDKNSGSGLTGSQDPLNGLKTWKKPNKEFLNFAVRHFQPFFPKETYYELGKTYYFIEDDQSFLNKMIADLSSNRYFPPPVKDEHITIHRLLTLFHPRPFIMSRFKPKGSIACVRAKNDKYIDIVFRIHAEFQLNTLPNYPFWFTPAQFTGHLIVTRDLKHLVHFNMYVPADKKLNVDMEWMEGRNNMVVDIGYMPEMSAKITSPSVPAQGMNLEEKLPEEKFDVDTIKWTEEISEEEALQMLKVEMYPFQKVHYYNMTESLEIAKKENKLIHHIMLWGALDDQSC